MHLDDIKVFWKNIDNIQATLYLDDAQFAKELHMSLKEYLKINREKKLIPLDKAFDFAEKMNFHIEDLFKTDFKLNYTIGSNTLLERYNYATYSHTKPIMSIINYLEQQHGRRAKINVLRKFQLSEEFLMDDTNKANIFLVSDISNHIQSIFDFTNRDFVKMGRTTPFVTKNNFLRKNLTGHENVQKMFEHFFAECTHLFDKNSTYALESLTNNYAIIAAIPKKEVVEELRLSNLQQFGSEAPSYNRAGIISSMTMFQFNMNAPVKKISSLYHGDPYDRYLLDLSLFSKAKFHNHVH